MLRTLVVLVALVVPSFALADVAFYPPTPPEPVGPTLRGQPYAASTSTAADHVLYTARNPTSVPVTLVLETLTEHGHALPLANVEANGRAVSGTITIPPGGTVHLVIHVPPPAAGVDARHRTFVLRATLAGRSTTATTSLRVWAPVPVPPTS